MSANEILKVENLCKSFVVEKSLAKKLKRLFKNEMPEQIKALNNVSFSVNEGETLGILGESGSGKSTLARALMGIHSVDSGSAVLMGRDILHVKGSERLAILRDMQMIFQDPYGSLDPRMRVREILSEPLSIHKINPEEGREAFLEKAIEEVGLSKDVLNRYPTEFSGGQRQRIGICRALILNPKLIMH